MILLKSYLLILVSQHVVGVYFSDSEEITLDGVILNAGLEVAPVRLTVGTESFEYSCPFPCNVARTVGPFCRSAFENNEETISSCMSSIWKAHATGEHLLNLRENIKQKNVDLGIQRGNNWFEENTLPWPRLFYDHLFPVLFQNLSLLDFLDTRPVSILEIGSYEGGSAMWFIRYLLGHAQSRLVCVDVWEYGATHSGENEILDRFRSNVQLTGYAHQVRAIKGDSLSALAQLIATDTSDLFDVVYIDGSHTSYDVMG